MQRPPPNPFLAALLTNAPSHDKRLRDLYASLTPAWGWIVLAPTADSLAKYDSAVFSDEVVGTCPGVSIALMIASHIIRVPAIGGKLLSVRNKSRHYVTHNGRTIVVKDDVVYTNKGFTDFRQAKLLHDTLIYPDSPDAAPLVVYFVDRLLLSIPVPALATPTRTATPRPQTSILAPKSINTLPQLFDEFPSIAKQVVPKLTSLLRDLNDKDPTDTDLSSGIEAIKRVVDGVISAVVDTFQSIDASTMKRLSERTDMNGEKLGRLIESYVLDETYDLVFFSFSKTYHERDTQLTDKILSLKSLDVDQVGIPYVDADILSRLAIAIERFRTFGAARTPMEKLEILLETVNILSGGETAPRDSEDEKPVPGALSSDFLVPLLLLVVLRSNVSNLESNLAYVRDFSYGDTDGGIVGYTLSSVEAVLYHINEDHARLAELGRRNERFWKAIKDNDLLSLKAVLTTSSDSHLSPPISPTRPRRGSLAEPHSTVFESKDGEGNSGFMMAIQRNNLEILQYLVSRPEAPRFLSNDENYQHETPLITAMQAENQPFVAILSGTLLRLPEPDLCRSLARQDKDGRTVGHYLFNAPELIWKLGKNLPWTIRDKFGQSPLSVLAKTWDHRDYSSMLSAAITACVESTGMNGQDHVDGKGNSLLHVCADEECMKRLLEIETIDPNVVNAKGLTPLLHWSKLASVRIELVKLLFHSKRVDVYARDPRGLTVLHLAAWKGHFEVLQEAVNWIDINERAGGSGVTALHVAAREKRMECIEFLVGDWNADLKALEGRGLTAGDMAKDDEVKERLDELALFRRDPIDGNRVTGVMRAVIDEDLNVSYIIKTALKPFDMTSLITTSRNLEDFQFLRHWLQYENPSSWFPSLPSPDIDPCAIPSRPARSVLHFLEHQLDSFLSTLLRHPTVANHELLWEFFMVADLRKDLIIERSKSKVENMTPAWEEEMPLEETSASEIFFDHARAQVDQLRHSYQVVGRKAQGVGDALYYLQEAVRLSKPGGIPGLELMETSGHWNALEEFSQRMLQKEPSLLTGLVSRLAGLENSITGILASLDKPRQLIQTFNDLKKTISKKNHSWRRSEKWPLGILDETRKRIADEAAEGLQTMEQEQIRAGKELKYTQGVIAGELSAFHAEHAVRARNTIRKFVENQVEMEKGRLRGMERALGLVKVKGRPSVPLRIRKQVEVDEEDI